MEDLEFLVFHPLNMPYIDKMFSTISFRFDLLLKESSPCYFRLEWRLHSNTHLKVVQNIGPLTQHWKAHVPSWIFVLKLRWKKFLKRCIMMFIVYIWSTIQHYNTNNYWDQYLCETQINISLECLAKSVACKVFIFCLLIQQIHHLVIPLKTTSMNG
jgi:hypothetical protein